MKTINKKCKLLAALFTLSMSVSIFTGCGNSDTKKTEQQKEQVQNAVPENEGDALEFKPSDLGILPQEKYEYPYCGINAVLSQNLLNNMENKDIIMLSNEDYNADRTIKYASLHWFSLTAEQKNETATAFDPDAWIAGLGKVGVLGVYHTDIINELDTLTGCTQHNEVGKSADGKYIYYLSTADEASETLKAELNKTEVTPTEMLPLDFNNGKTAFSAGRSNAKNVGEFTTTDINDKTYTNELFSEYDLTLVNIFATWCSPCINEMPEFEKFKQEMNAKGINVVAVVHDAVTPTGETDSRVIDTALQLQKMANLTFPLLIPDETYMNGRLKGIEAYPESFFVDKNGNIVSEPYVGARSFEEWKEVAETELANLKGNN